jgi:hypothetical protein
MVDEEARADLGPGVNLNTSKEPIDVRGQASEKIKPAAPKPVRESVKEDCVKTRVAEDDLDGRPGSRIPIEDHINVALNGCPPAHSPISLKARQ